MTQALGHYEEITFEQFIIFIKSHHQQLEENINSYLNLETAISESDRKVIKNLLDTFLQFLTSPNLQNGNDVYKSYLDNWLQSQLSTLTMKRFNLFRLLFEKSFITLMLQIKHNRTSSFLMFLLSIFTYLDFSYEKWIEVPKKNGKQHDKNKELTKFELIDQLNKLLILSSGVHDLAFILKKCEEYFHYKRCVFYAYIPWSNQFYGVIGSELPKVQSMKGHLNPKQAMLFNTKQPIFLKNPENFIKEEHIHLFNLSSVIFIPIAHDNQLYGWLTFDQLGEEFDCSKEELDILEEVGIRLGLFFARKSEQIEKTTGLHLTERETMILDLLAEGYDNKKMAELLYLSEHTVRDYVSSLMTKLKAKNRTQVVASAFRLGLLK